MRLKQVQLFRKGLPRYGVFEAVRCPIFGSYIGVSRPFFNGYTDSSTYNSFGVRFPSCDRISGIYHETFGVVTERTDG